MIDGEGRVADVGMSANVPEPPDCRRVDLPDEIVLPGLVNAHTHLELSALHSNVCETGFPAWIRHIRTVKQTIDEDGFLHAAREGVRQTWRYGTTTVADTGTSGAAARALAELGGRGVYYQEVIAPEPERCEEAMAVAVRMVETLQCEAGTALTVGLSPHAPYTVSPALYARVARHARSEGLPLAAHVAESRAEAEFLTASRGAFAEAWQERGIPLPPRSRSCVAYMDSVGLLGPDLLAIHAVQVDDRDMAKLAERGVAVAVCPRSNARHGHGDAPLHALLAAGISCGLGTDSLASVESLDLWAEAAAIQRQGIEAEDVMRLLTIGGARAIGQEEHVGSLEPGKWADLCVVRTLAMEPLGAREVAAAVLEAGSAGVRSTYVAGRAVHQESS